MKYRVSYFTDIDHEFAHEFDAPDDESAILISVGYADRKFSTIMEAPLGTMGPTNQVKLERLEDGRAFEVPWRNLVAL